MKFKLILTFFIITSFLCFWNYKTQFLLSFKKNNSPQIHKLTQPSQWKEFTSLIKYRNRLVEHMAQSGEIKIQNLKPYIKITDNWASSLPTSNEINLFFEVLNYYDTELSHSLSKLPLTKKQDPPTTYWKNLRQTEERLRALIQD